ncbi:MAG TPA: NAD(P)/FAD-dependent oxidoreductase, partial [Solirubrobacteraceae bacterium]
SWIRNYLGFPGGISGSELAERAMLQASSFGARLVVPAQAARLSGEKGEYVVELEDGGALRGRTVIVATGARYRKLDVPDLERYEANGVFYAATQVEAQQCAGDPVLIVGGGNSAGQAALFVSEYAGSCSLVIRGEELEKSMSSYLVDQLFRSPRVQLIRSSEVEELCGETGLEAVTIRDRRTGELRSLAATSIPPSAPPTTAIILSFWRRACAACSPSETCIPARSSAWPPRSAKARWRCAWFTSGWLRRWPHGRPSVIVARWRLTAKRSDG